MKIVEDSNEEAEVKTKPKNVTEQQKKPIPTGKRKHEEEEDLEQKFLRMHQQSNNFTVIILFISNSHNNLRIYQKSNPIH